MRLALLSFLLAGALMAQTKPDNSNPAAVPDLLKPATLNQTAPAVFRAKLTTTKGDVVIEVTRDWAPLGVDRFYNLVQAGFFTDCSFYRTIAGFMTQFGISARPDVSRAWGEATIADDPVKQSNTRGKITFATAGPSTRSTQFFINFGDNSRLDALGFAPFGEVVEGMDVVDKIYPGYDAAPAEQYQRIQEQGKAYLDEAFPMLDRILTATIVPVPTAPPAPKE
jgi:peptidyl-prolyl cis-trans isomerase A (cyclophilin A)